MYLKMHVCWPRTISMDSSCISYFDLQSARIKFVSEYIPSIYWAERLNIAEYTLGIIPYFCMFAIELVEVSIVVLFSDMKFLLKLDSKETIFMYENYLKWILLVWGLNNIYLLKTSLGNELVKLGLLWLNSYPHRKPYR